MSEEKTQGEVEQQIRMSRGAQLRALVLSWHIGITYQHALQKQAEELQTEEFEISDDWSDIAEQIFLSFEAQQSATVFDSDGQPT